MSDWTVLAGVVLAWFAQYMRGKQSIPTVWSYAAIVVFGFVLFMVGYEGAFAFTRQFVAEGLMWVAALFGIGRVLADAKAAPKTNAIP